ncbi:MAG: hypothetical protein HC771_24450 [Synechococcales cyanobacterium CRU_2_2]|nr:hypothetical protein [Synechococcales cyanobacterium CRU_2_2]
MSRRPANYLVLRGYYGNTFRQNYLDYLSGLTERGQNIGTGDPKPETQDLYILPFAFSNDANIRAEVGATVPAWQALGALAGIASRAAVNPPVSTEAVKLGGFKPARIIRKTQTGNGVRAVSARTKLPYLKYNTTSVSVPIGREDGTDTISAALAEITPQIKAGLATAKVYLRDEDS